MARKLSTPDRGKVYPNRDEFVKYLRTTGLSDEQAAREVERWFDSTGEAEKISSEIGHQSKVSPRHGGKPA